MRKALIDAAEIVVGSRVGRIRRFGLVLVSGLSLAASVQAAAFDVNPLVSFTPLAATYRSLNDTDGCPVGFVGKFTFSAVLTNKAASPAVPGLAVRVQTLSNGNVLLDPQSRAILGGVGAIMPVPRVAQYADGLLSAGETVAVPFVLCLKSRQSFQFLVDVSGVVTQLVSVNRLGVNSGNSSSGSDSIFPNLSASISADGRFVAFTSEASNLVAVDTNGKQDVFVRDLQTGTTTLVSVSRTGDSSNRAAASPVLSADGRFVAFLSDASDLAAVDTNGTTDVFVRNLEAGTTTLVSLNRAGADSGNNSSGVGVSGSTLFSADSRFITFFSAASDLVTTDTNEGLDVFVRDLKTGTTTLASINRGGTDSGNGYSAGSVLSANGRLVAFWSYATDLVSIATLGLPNVFVRDLQTRTTSLVSVNNLGTASGNGISSISAFPFSSDGRFIAFASKATNLLPNDTNEGSDIFVRDLLTGTTVLASPNRFGTNGGTVGSVNAGSVVPVLSATGRFVAFTSDAADLVATDTNGALPGFDVFVRDLQAGTTALVSVNRAGIDSGNASSFLAGLSADGRIVAFTSNANDLVTNDTLGSAADTFVRDLQTGTTILMSVNKTGVGSGNFGSSAFALSADGHVVAFASQASDLVVNDSNGYVDVFVRPVP